MIKAVIFDMDGTMFDTEDLWWGINSRLAAKYNVQAIFNDDVRMRMTGKKDVEALTIMKEYCNLTTPVEELVSIRRQMILENIALVKIKKGLTELLELLDQLAIQKAIATSAFRAFTHALLTSFHLENRFHVVVTGDEVTISKPHPAIFLETARQLNIEPKDCLVLEDSQNGVEAAINARMKTIAIPHERSRNHNFSRATLVLSSLTEIDEKLLKSL